MTIWTIQRVVVLMKKKFALILFAFISSCLLVVGQEKKADYWITEGMSKFDVESYTDAKVCFDKAISLNSSNSEAWYGKGLALNGMSDLAEREDPPDSLAAKNYYVEAIGSLKKAIEINPLYAKAYVELGWAEAKVGLAQGNDEMYKTGLESIDKAIAIEPNYSEAVDVKGAIFYLNNEWQAALEQFTKATLIDANNSNAWFNMGKTLEKLNDNQGADKAFKRSAEISNQTI
jgi:tetratricopeptide (TPR) repeat protein